MKREKQLEIENSVLRKVIADVQDRIRQLDLSDDYAYAKAVGAIMAITDNEWIQSNITKATENA